MRIVVEPRPVGDAPGAFVLQPLEVEIAEATRAEASVAFERRNRENRCVGRWRSFDDRLWQHANTGVDGTAGQQVAYEIDREIRRLIRISGRRAEQASPSAPLTQDAASAVARKLAGGYLLVEGRLFAESAGPQRYLKQVGVRRFAARDGDWTGERSNRSRIEYALTRHSGYDAEILSLALAAADCEEVQERAPEVTNVILAPQPARAPDLTTQGLLTAAAHVRQGLRSLAMADASAELVQSYQALDAAIDEHQQQIARSDLGNARAALESMEAILREVAQNERVVKDDVVRRGVAINLALRDLGRTRRILIVDEMALEDALDGGRP